MDAEASVHTGTVSLIVTHKTLHKYQHTAVLLLWTSIYHNDAYNIFALDPRCSTKQSHGWNIQTSGYLKTGRLYTAFSQHCELQAHCNRQVIRLSEGRTGVTCQQPTEAASPRRRANGEKARPISELTRITSSHRATELLSIHRAPSLLSLPTIRPRTT